MNLRQLAEKDLAVTLTDKDNGGAVEFTISKPSGTGYTVNGFLGDIGYLLDTEGNPVSGRTVTAIFRMSDLTADDEYMQPGRGWKVIYTDLSGHEWILYITRFEPDRTLGIGRLILSLDLEAKD